MQDCEIFAVVGVPDTRGPIIGSGDDARPVGAEGGRVHMAIVASQNQEFFAGGGVPDARGVVV